MTDDHTTTSPRSTRVLLFAFAFWLGLGLVTSMLAYVQEVPDGTLQWRPFHSLKPALAFLVHVPASVWLWYASEPIARDGLRPHLGRTAALLLLSSVAASAWQWMLFDGSNGVMILGSVLFCAMQLAGVLAVGASYHATRLAQQRNNELLDARLRSLRDQLRPHALFNTLQAIGSTAEQDGATAARMIALLGDMLRHSLAHESGALVTLGEELATLDPYLQLQRLRFADRLRIEIDVPDAVRRARVPDLLLQPLIENALLHGIERRPGVGSIQIRAVRDGDLLHLEVADDGLPSAPSAREYGTGLANTALRLNTLFGARASLQVDQNGRGGTTARLRLPFREDSLAA